VQKKGPDLIQIIEGCVKKDLTCEQLLYKTFYGYVSGVAFRYLRDREMLKELVNDAFVKIFSKIDNFQFIGDDAELSKVFKGWIAKITANLAIDKIRSHKQLVYVEEVEPDRIIEMSVQPSDRLSFNDIMALLGQLPPLQQIIFNMYAIEGFSHEEIAKELNMPPNTSRVYLKRAREKLMILYQAEENEQRTRARVF
jgi:RNA polymerase sigma factor (sigma-70 family)